MAQKHCRNFQSAE